MNDDDAVRHLTTFARPLILNRWRKDSCLVSTAVALDFLSWAGVKAKPMEVEVLAYNALAVELIERGVPYTEWPADAWSVGIVQADSDPEQRKYKAWTGAHLVTLVAERTLLDLSADQLSRPLYRMSVPGPIVLPWDGDGTKAVSAEGAIVVYRRPERPDLSFRSSPDWRLRGRRADIVSELVRLARLVGAEQ